VSDYNANIKNSIQLIMMPSNNLVTEFYLLVFALWLEINASYELRKDYIIS
jgi:hypothetical protein